MDSLQIVHSLYSSLSVTDENPAQYLKVILDHQLLSLRHVILIKYKNITKEISVSPELYQEILINSDIVSVEPSINEHSLILKLKINQNHSDFINRINKMNSLTKFINKEIPFPSLKYQNILSEFTFNQMAPKLPFELFPYQKNTIYLMNQLITQPQECQVSTKIKDDLYLNKFSNLFTKEPEKVSFEIKGGIIADEMGLGKTITSIAFTETQDSLSPDFDVKNLYYPFQSKAHLILVPSHLGKQWVNEIKKCYPHKTCLTIFTKSQHETMTTEDVMKADFVIVSYQFLSNCSYYPSYLYYAMTPSRFSLKAKQEFIKNYNKNDLYQEHPILETIRWNQIIVDEGHEIMENTFGTGNITAILHRYLEMFQGKNYWYVSGTPFTSDIGLKHILKFLKLKFKVEYRDLANETHQIEYQITDNGPYQNLINHPDFQSKVIFRHTKEQVETQINLKGLKEDIHWLNQTEMEKQLYQASRAHKSREYLLQLCCHLLVADLTSTTKFQTVNLEDVKKNLLETHNNNVKTYTQKLTLLDPKNQSYHMLKKKYNDIVSQSKYILETLKNLDKESEKESTTENECPICMDIISDPALLSCGHIFCYDCIEFFTNNKKACPLCKAEITDKIVRVKSVTSHVEKKDELEEKYGAKTGFLIKLVRKILADKDNKIIIFSQYDFMLNLVSDSLSANGVANSFVKGNVHQRVKAIEKFKGLRLNEDENKVIMLSLKNAASGTHLVEANHIIFIEPIDKSKKVVEDIENQAIARAFRIGQKNKVNIHRLFVKNTLEEEIYNNVYKVEDL